MADFSHTFAHLDGAALGVFGVGHLGSVIASGLIQNDFPISRLLVCHGGSPETAVRLADAGLSERIVQANELTQRSRIILYLVRPQNLNAIGNCELLNDALIISFLAGTPLARIPLGIVQGNRVRVMPSAPDTIVRGKAIGGVYPSGNPVVEELLRALGIEQIFLDKESDMHVFTALGVCLPIVLAYCKAQGKCVDEEELIDCAQRHGLGNFEKILEWTHSAEPHFETQIEQEAYMKKAATPGGVTEAMLHRIKAGGSLTQAIEGGIIRSEELGEGSA